jgi:hypothetical protein
MSPADENVLSMVPALLREIRDEVRGVKAEATELRSEVRAGFEQVNNRLDALHAIMQRQDKALAERVARLEARMDALGARQ